MQTAISRGGGTGRHAVLRGQWALLVRVRVPLSAHIYISKFSYSKLVKI